MSRVTKQDRSYLQDLLKYQEHLNGKSTVIAELRESSAAQVQQLPFPTNRDEDWRFTDLKPITRDSFVPVRTLKGTGEVSGLEEYYLPESDKTRLVFINGVYSEEHSSVEDLPDGVHIGHLSDLDDEDNAHIEKHLNRYAEYENDVFTAFNGAFLEDGAFIYLPKETKIESPVQLLNIYTDADEHFFVTPRTLIVGEMYSKMTLVEDHVSLADNTYMTLPVNEFKLFEGANITHVKLIRDNKNAIHVARPAASVDKHAHYESYTVTLGARLSRNDPKIIQTEPEVDFTLDGLVLIDGDQVADTHSVMDHRFSYGNSHQLHKCVINGKAHSIFNGKIFVRQDAQKIDSFQENRNLLLSRDGQVNTKPQLEIFADDVLCSHGATVGQLEEEEMFYLKSRGLSEQKARELLTYGFALEVIESIPVESVQRLLEEEVERYARSAKAKVEA